MLEDLTFKSLGVMSYHETLDLMKSHIKEEDFRIALQELRFYLS